MNFQIGVLLCVAACAFALPLPDEEVSTLVKSPEVAPAPTVAPVEGLKIEHPASVKTEAVPSSVAGTVPVEKVSKTEPETDLGTPTESGVENTSVVIHDEIKEVPKSLPVTTRGTEAVVPPFAGARVEPKEGVEVAEAKSTASSPNTEETEKKSESKPSTEIQPITESNISGSSSVEKKDPVPVSNEKPKPEDSNNSTPIQPVVAGETKPEDSAPTTVQPKETEKTNLKPVNQKDKHDHSSETNKTVESAESSEESDEKSK